MWSGALSGACAVALVYLAQPARMLPHRGTVALVPAQAVVAPATPEVAAPEPEASAAQPVAAARESAPEDAEVIADLDNVLQREESRLWTEDTARF